MEGKYFWANGSTYGTIEQKKKGDSMKVKIDVLGEDPLEIKEFLLRGYGTYISKKVLKIHETIEFEIIRK